MGVDLEAGFGVFGCEAALEEAQESFRLLLGSELVGVPDGGGYVDFAEVRIIEALLLLNFLRRELSNPYSTRPFLGLWGIGSESWSMCTGGWWFRAGSSLPPAC